MPKLRVPGEGRSYGTGETVALETVGGLPAGSDRRYEEIIAAAEQLIHDRGYHAVSVRDLATAVGINMSSLYYYFSSKEQILYAISRRTMERLTLKTDEVLIERQGEPVDRRLAAALRVGVIFHIEHQAAAGVVLSEGRRLGGTFYADLRGLMKAYESKFTCLVEEGIASGRFNTRDSTLATFILMSALTRVSIWYRPEGRLKAAEVAEIYSESLVNMLTHGSLDSTSSV